MLVKDSINMSHCFDLKVSFDLLSRLGTNFGVVYWWLLCVQVGLLESLQAWGLFGVGVLLEVECLGPFFAVEWGLSRVRCWAIVFYLYLLYIVNLLLSQICERLPYVWSSSLFIAFCFEIFRIILRDFSISLIILIINQWRP